MIRILDESAVGEVLSMSAGLRLVEDAFRQHALGEVTMAPRTALDLDGEAGSFRVMTAALPEMGSFGLKTLTGIPGRRRSDEIYFAMLLFDGDTGGLRCILPAGGITPIRTGAAGGVAAKHLSREDSSELGVFGSGVQARAQVSAIREVRPIDRAKIFDVDPDSAAAFTRELESEGLEAQAVPDSREAVRDVDIVVTATTAREPLFPGEWIEEGTHINAIGANSPVKKELDPEAFRRAKVVVDYREQVLLEAGDVIDAIEAGAVDEDGSLTELGDVVAGRSPGRETPEQITLFKSVGVAFQDIAVAAWIHDEARRRDLGVQVAMER